jgi:hypothetical protein
MSGDDLFSQAVFLQQLLRDLQDIVFGILITPFEELLQVKKLNEKARG